MPRSLSASSSSPLRSRVRGPMGAGNGFYRLALVHSLGSLFGLAASPTASPAIDSAFMCGWSSSGAADYGE